MLCGCNSFGENVQYDAISTPVPAHVLIDTEKNVAISTMQKIK